MKELSAEEYGKYFPGEESSGKFSVIDIARLTVTSGRLTAQDQSGELFGISCYTQEIPRGDYAVKASVINYGSGGYRIAAVKVCFTCDEPARFQMALREGEDVSRLDPGQFFGFGVDSGSACIADCDVMGEYLDYQDDFEDDPDFEDDFDRDFYTDHLEPLLAAGYEKYPGLKVDFIDYVVPGTDHHMAIVQSGLGDGVYPVYFGFSEAGELCCAVAVFIFS